MVELVTKFNRHGDKVEVDSHGEMSPSVVLRNRSREERRDAGVDHLLECHTSPSHDNLSLAAVGTTDSLGATVQLTTQAAASSGVPSLTPHSNVTGSDSRLRFK